MKQKIKIIFFGSDSFSLPILKELEDNFKIKLIVTKKKNQLGKKFRSPTLILDKFDSKSIAKIKDIPADLYVVVAFGLMIPKQLLKSPTGVATINLHPSLLPKYRGPSPIESAILAGDKKTGISIIILDEKMDHGPIIAQEKEIIDKEDDFITLSERLERRGTDLLIKTIPDFVAGKIKFKPQNDAQASYCRLIKKENGKIDFTQNAGQILRHLRAYVHWPGSFANWSEKNKSVKIISARLQSALPEPPITAGLIFKTDTGKPAIVCGQDAIIIEILQLEGKKPTDSISFLNGYPDFIGGNLG